MYFSPSFYSRIYGSAVMSGSENTDTSVSVHATSSSDWSLITSAVELEKAGRGFFRTDRGRVLSHGLLYNTPWLSAIPLALMGFLSRS